MTPISHEPMHRLDMYPLRLVYLHYSTGYTAQSDLHTSSIIRSPFPCCPLTSVGICNLQIPNIPSAQPEWNLLYNLSGITFADIAFFKGQQLSVSLSAICLRWEKALSAHLPHPVSVATRRFERRPLVQTASLPYDSDIASVALWQQKGRKWEI